MQYLIYLGLLSAGVESKAYIQFVYLKEHRQYGLSVMVVGYNGGNDFV